MATYIMMVGRICGDSFDWEIAMPPLPESEPVDGELQRAIWEAEETEDYEDDIIDREFWARGQW